LVDGIFDGFRHHTSSLQAMQIQADANILFVKEEGDSSHANQAYDKYVATKDKGFKKEIITLLHNQIFYNKGVVDQLGMVHVCVFVICDLKLETRMNSLYACNLDLRTRVQFPDWCKNIEHFLQAGKTFKVEDHVDLYAFLPPTCHGMPKVNKFKVVSVAESHGTHFSDDLCKVLYT
jgi:hypothetical protein